MAETHDKLKVLLLRHTTPNPELALAVDAGVDAGATPEATTKYTVSFPFGKTSDIHNKHAPTGSEEGHIGNGCWMR